MKPIHELYLLETKEDRDLVNFLPFNRPSSKRASLAESMNEEGFTQAITLIKTDIFDGIEKLYVTDGQHRFKTAVDLNIPIKAHILPNKFETEAEVIKHVSRLNNSSVAWKLTDYVNAYSHTGNRSYIYLQNEHKNTGIPVSTLAPILMNRVERNSAKKVKDGSFVVFNKNEEFISAVLEAKKMSGRMITGFFAAFQENNAISNTFWLKQKVERFNKNYNSFDLSKLDNFKDYFKNL